MSVAPEKPSRPALAFRVGITGTRDLTTQPDAAQTRIRNQVQSVLEAVRDEVMAVAQHNELWAAHDDGPRLRLLSPLAEGADRLAAEVAESIGYTIEVALPFARTEYAKDFTAPTSRAAFERWLGLEGAPDARSYIALDGGRGDDETASYEAVGRLVVRNCDLLVAVWDGKPARGRGGTGDIVRFAVRFGLPVWWIDATGPAPPRLLQTAADLRGLGDAPPGAETAGMLVRLIRRMLLPPEHHRHGHGLIGRPLHFLLGPGEAPLQAYLHGLSPLRNPLWRLYGWTFRILGGPRAASASKPIPDPVGPAAYWDTLYRPADRASTAYADRYRSSYVWIFLLATLAVVCAVAALAYEPWKPAATVSEIILLGLILALVIVNERRNWHGRWIACRLLAELCRKQGALATLGWSLPTPDLRRSLHADGAQDDEHEGGHRDKPAPRGPPEAWAAWYFDAALRAAPLPRGALTGSQLSQARDYVRSALVGEQGSYHEDRHVRCRRAGQLLVRFGEAAFLATLILVVVKLALLGLAGETGAEGHATAEHGGGHGGPLHAVIVGLGAAAAVLPAASAAFFGIRAYAELELLESQSARMTRLMKAAGRRIDRLDLTRPLASQDLAAEVLEVSSAMLQEVGGWAELFRVKAVEAG